MNAAWVTTWDSLGAAWAGPMWRACWQGALFILAIAILCRFWTGLPARARCWLWWLACLKLVTGLVCVRPLALPVLPASELGVAAPSTATGAVAVPADLNATVGLVSSATAAPSLASPRGQARGSAQPQDQSSRSKPLAGLLLGAWLMGLALQMAVLLRQLLAASGMARSAQPVRDPVPVRLAGELAMAVGLGRRPPVLESASANSPLVTGIRHPAILLPKGAADRFSAHDLRMALAHEIAHVRRGDLWLAVIPRVAQALFFFHPLAWLAGREWAAAAESACDAEALRITNAPAAEYGRLLVRFAAAGRGPAVAAALGVTGGFQTLRRRLKMLPSSARSCTHGCGPARSRRGLCRLAGCAGALLLSSACILPWRLIAWRSHAPDRTARVAEQWEEMLLLEATRYLRLSRAQLALLKPVSQSAEACLAKLLDEDERTLATVERVAQRNREALLAGRAGLTREQSDALGQRSVLRQRKEQAETEIAQDTATRLARILSREQTLRALQLAQGQAPAEDPPSPALLDPESGFVLGVNSPAAARSARPALVDLDHYGSLDLYVLSRLEEHGRRPDNALAHVSRPISDGRWLNVTRLPPPQREVFWVSASDGCSGCHSRPGTHLTGIVYRPGQNELYLERACPAGGEGRLRKWLLEGSSEEERATVLRPLARRLVLSPRFGAVLEECTARGRG
jgi:beta-lactamase regulating signal transducer with metallopeptidase domain